MIRTIICFILLSTFPAFADEKPWHPICPKTIHNSYECAQYLQNTALKKYSDIATREGETLIIKLNTGGITKLSDKDTNPNEMVGYSLVEVYREIGYALVHAQYWEGGTYELINLQTGQIENIKGWPLISPKEKYLVSINFGDIAGYTDSVIKIYRLTRPHLTPDWSLMPSWSPSDPHWISDSKLELNKNSFNPTLCEELHKNGKYKNDFDCYVKDKVFIIKTKGQWQLQ
jgi:hypothetical protein